MSQDVYCKLATRTGVSRTRVRHRQALNVLKNNNPHPPNKREDARSVREVPPIYNRQSTKMCANGKSRLPLWCHWQLLHRDKAAREEGAPPGLRGWWEPVWVLCNRAVYRSLQQLLTIRIRKHRSQLGISSGTAPGPPTRFC